MGKNVKIMHGQSEAQHVRIVQQKSIRVPSVFIFSDRYNVLRVQYTSQPMGRGALT